MESKARWRCCLLMGIAGPLFLLTTCDLRTARIPLGVPATLVEENGQLYLKVPGSTLYSGGEVHEDKAPLSPSAPLAVITRKGDVFLYHPAMGDISSTGLSEATNRVAVAHILFADPGAGSSPSVVRPRSVTLTEGPDTSGVTISRLNYSHYRVRNDKKRWASVRYRSGGPSTIEFLDPRGNFVEINLWDAITQGLQHLVSFAKKDSVDIPIPDDPIVVHGAVYKALPVIITDRLLGYPPIYGFHEQIDRIIQEDLDVGATLLALEKVDAVALAINTTASMFNFEQVTKPITSSMIQILGGIFQDFMRNVLVDRRSPAETINALGGVFGDAFIETALDAILASKAVGPSVSVHSEVQNRGPVTLAKAIKAIRKVLKVMITTINCIDWMVIGAIDTLTASPYEVIGHDPVPVFQRSFDTDTTGIPPAGWLDSYDTFGTPNAHTREQAEAMGVTIKVSDATYFGSSGKSVHFLDAHTGVGSVMTHPIPSLTTVVLEYHMLTQSATHEGPWVLLAGDGGTDYAVGFNPNGYIGVHGWKGGWIHSRLLGYQPHTWYRVVRTLHAESNTGLFYVEEVGNPSNHGSYAIGSNYVNSYVNSIMMLSPTSKTTDGFVDEVRISGTP